MLENDHSPKTENHLQVSLILTTVLTVKIPEAHFEAWPPMANE